MELIVEKGYESITVQDITDRANVARTTFYLHFNDKEELLFTSMQKIYDGLVSGHDGFMPMDGQRTNSTRVPCDTSDFKHVAEYADFYRMMLSKQGSVVFILRVMSYLTEVIKPTLRKGCEGRAENAARFDRGVFGRGGGRRDEVVAGERCCGIRRTTWRGCSSSSRCGASAGRWGKKNRRRRRIKDLR